MSRTILAAAEQSLVEVVCARVIKRFRCVERELEANVDRPNIQVEGSTRKIKL